MNYYGSSVMQSVSKDEGLGAMKEGFSEEVEISHIVGEN